MIPLTQGNYGRIARLTGYSKPHISKVLRGVSGASLKCIGAIAKRTGHTFDEVRTHVELRGAALKAVL